MKSLFNPSRMKYAICMKDTMGRMTALACACTVQLAQSLATAMANDLNLSEYYSPRHRPLLYVFDLDGRNYGSY